MYKTARRLNQADDNHLPPSQWRTEGFCSVQTPPPKFRRPSKIVPNSTRFAKIVKNCNI